MQTGYSIRDDFTDSFSKGGCHTAKLGGEYPYMMDHNEGLFFNNGTLDAKGGAIPINKGHSELTPT